jgi:hypothetical protein
MKTWNFVEKADWPNRGQWDTEPDKAHWIDERTGLDCLIHRGPSGALCGYVGVPESHPYFGMDYDALPDSLDVHGGLTFSDSCHGNEEGRGICHPKEGAANESVWWFGFDCAHLGDFCPSHDRSYGYAGSYKSMGYVQSEVASLAAQLSSPQPSPSTEPLNDH